MHFYEDKPCLYYHQKQQIRNACEWFWWLFEEAEEKMSPAEAAHFLKKIYQYEDLIIVMAYTLYLENIQPKNINFHKLIEQKIFINPFETA